MLQMQNQNGQLFYGECINAFLQGYFDNQKIQDNDQINGTGIVLDDELNFFVSEYFKSKFNGATFMRMHTGHMIYGNFKENRPSGVIGITKGEYRIYLSISSQKDSKLLWKKEAAIINTQTNLLYVLQLSEKKEKINEQDRPQMFGTQNFNADKKTQWKIKILDRCLLKSDWKLSGYSKLISSLEKQKLLEFKKSEYSVQEQNILPLISSILGGVFKEAHLISPYSFLRHFQMTNSKISVYQLNKSQDSKEDVLFITLNDYRPKKSKSNKRLLGFLLRKSNYIPLALGHFDFSYSLNGFGAHFSRNKYSIGLFKENMMTKEYSHVDGSDRETNAYQLRELLAQQHLKAINYIHQSHYVPEVAQIVSVANKIIKYVVAFEKEYQKRHLSYNDTFVDNSMSSQYINVMKYVQEQEKKPKYAEEEIRNEQLALNTTQRSARKPGFIMNKPRDTSNSPIATQRMSPNSKSPLRQVRIMGKILSKSPSERKTSAMKQNASTIRRGEY